MLDCCAVSASHLSGFLWALSVYCKCLCSALGCAAAGLQQQPKMQLVLTFHTKRGVQQGFACLVAIRGFV